jgi:hypothetical protein
MNEEVTMREALANDGSKDVRGLMRLVQGSVLPQVNGGVAEVAECFLKKIAESDAGNDGFAPIPLTTAEQARALRAKLQDALVQFLDLCRRLIIKSRRALDVPYDPPPSRTSTEERTQEEVNADNNRVWQIEMERGFIKLVAQMAQYVSDGEGWADLEAQASFFSRG